MDKEQLSREASEHLRNAYINSKLLTPELARQANLVSKKLAIKKEKFSDKVASDRLNDEIDQGHDR